MLVTGFSYTGTVKSSVIAYTENPLAAKLMTCPDAAASVEQSTISMPFSINPFSVPPPPFSPMICSPL